MLGRHSLFLWFWCSQRSVASSNDTVIWDCRFLECKMNVWTPVSMINTSIASWCLCQNRRKVAKVSSADMSRRRSNWWYCVPRHTTCETVMEWYLSNGCLTSLVSKPQTRLNRWHLGSAAAGLALGISSRFALGTTERTLHQVQGTSATLPHISVLFRILQPEYVPNSGVRGTTATAV